MITVPLSDILIILEKYKYLVIFPIAIVEGPIIIVISGFLVYLGFLNIFVAFLVLVTGDIIGDSLYYAIGRYGQNVKFLHKIAEFLGYTPEAKEMIEDHFKNHMIKTLLLAKVSHGLGSAVQVTAGIAKIDFYRYLVIETIGTIPKTLALVILGLYIGNSYEKINTYLDSIALIVVGVFFCVILYLILNKYVKNYFTK